MAFCKDCSLVVHVIGPIRLVVDCSCPYWLIEHNAIVLDRFSLLPMSTRQPRAAKAGIVLSATMQGHAASPTAFMTMSKSISCADCLLAVLRTRFVDKIFSYIPATSLPTMAQTKDHDMILVMGLTGAGKSYFINQLTGMAVDVVEEGKKLKSCKSSLRNPTVNWSLIR